MDYLLERRLFSVETVKPFSPAGASSYDKDSNHAASLHPAQSLGLVA